MLKTSDERNSSSGLPSRPRLQVADASLAMLPKMLSGENPPAVAPLITISPIRTRLISYRMAKPIAIGATMATAAGTTAPKAVRMAVTPNITHGIITMRPPTDFTDTSTSQSTVPLSRARANRYVTPTRMTNRSPGKPRRTPSMFSSSPSSVPGSTT